MVHLYKLKKVDNEYIDQIGKTRKYISFNIIHQYIGRTQETERILYKNIRIKTYGLELTGKRQPKDAKFDIYYRTTYIHIFKYVPILSKIFELIADQNVEEFKFENPIFTVVFSYEHDNGKGELLIIKH